jgi:TonB family protein
MLDNEPQISFDSVQPVSPSKRRLQLLFALTLLLTALVLVVIKNRQFWSDAIGFEWASEQTTYSPIKTIKKGEQRLNLPLGRKPGARHSASSNPQAETGVAAESRETVLPPLQVDVTYSSGEHQILVASNSAIHIDPQQNSQPSSTMPVGAIGVGTGGASSAGVRVRFSGQTVEILGRPAEPVYPLMAQQANVQGSVVLQARIREDGTVDTLEVISGPGILTAAALEAVKQWHFKPHYQDGKAVPAETRITVNFSISSQ